MYYKEVDKRYRETMVKFLKKHFRYHTMNSWNKSTSYANNIKLYNIDKPDSVDEETWWEMLWITEWQEKMSDLLEDFNRKHEWQWQVGINGRSGGYVVLSSNRAVIKATAHTAARRIMKLCLKAREASVADAMLKQE